jgi:hypothetical protein
MLSLTAENVKGWVGHYLGDIIAVSEAFAWTGLRREKDSFS